MLKRVFYILLSVVVLLSSLVLPASAYVINSNYDSSAYNQAYLDLRINSLNKGTSFNVPYLTWNFTEGDTSSGISYPFIKDNYSYDSSGYVFYLRVLSSDIYANPSFRLDLATTTGSYYYFTDFSSFTLGLYTYFYKSFSSSEFFSLFEGSLVPKYFNFSSLIYSQVGIFASIDWGVVGALSWSNFYSVIDSQSSYDNGFTDGSNVISSPFDNATVYLSYYHLGSWQYVLPLNISADLDDYISENLIDLSLLTGFNFRFSDIPAGATKVTLSLKLPFDFYAPAYQFSAYNPSNLIIGPPASPYGVFFSDELNSTLGNIPPAEAVTNGSNISYNYFFPVTDDNNYTYVNLALDPIVVRSLTSSSVINDYISYQLVDYNTLVNNYYDQGYDKGYAEGEDVGYQDGKDVGYIEGKSDGLNEGMQNPFLGLFSALIDAPISAFSNLLSFEIFGQNMASFVLSILTLLLIIKVVKVVI